MARQNELTLRLFQDSSSRDLQSSGSKRGRNMSERFKTISGGYSLPVSRLRYPATNKKIDRSRIESLNVDENERKPFDVSGRLALTPCACYSWRA